MVMKYIGLIYIFLKIIKIVFCYFNMVFFGIFGGWILREYMYYCLKSLLCGLFMLRFRIIFCKYFEWFKM